MENTEDERYFLIHCRRLKPYGILLIFFTKNILKII